MLAWPTDPVTRQQPGDGTQTDPAKNRSAPYLRGTFDWTQNCVDFEADTPRVEAARCRRFCASTNSGNMWCDDVTLELVRSAFPSGDGR